ncbi:MAG: MazG family protein [Actinomycetota bacterium]
MPRGDRFLDLVEVMDTLRSPGGCPWDARQTHRSLVEYLVEEAYETVEAIEIDDDPGLREELGDLLLQIVVHARIAQDAETPWDIDDVADGIITKLIARHPHVFGDATADTAEQVEANWHALKAKEKGRTSVTDGIPDSLPALVRASKLLARSVALDLPALPEQAAADVTLKDVQSEEEFGSLLLALVAAARHRDWDAESALRQAVRMRIAEIREGEK